MRSPHLPMLACISCLNNLQLYSFDDVASSVDLPGGFVIGAGAGSSKFVGVNCEVNLYLSANCLCTLNIVIFLM